VERRQALAGTTLKWKQPKWSVDRFELRSDGRVLGELYWTKCLSDQAVACYGESIWILDRRGFFRDRVVALEPSSKAPEASFTFECLKDGDLILADGRSFRWYRTKIFDTAWALVDSAGGAVFEIHLGMDWFKYQATVRLWPDARAIPELGLLLCLGMYLSVCTMQDYAAGALAATTATVG
jgi:hypothetical protein